MKINFSQESTSSPKLRSFLIGLQKTFKEIFSDKEKQKMLLGFIFLVVLFSSSLFLLSKDTRSRLVSEKDSHPTAYSRKDNLPSHDFFSGFADLASNHFFKKDAFTLVPESSDSVGVDGDSAYILKSKEVLGNSITKEQLKFEPAIKYDISKISDREWKLQPLEDLKPNTLVKVRLTGYIEGEEDYIWGYQVKDNFKVLHSIPRESGVSVPINTGIEITFSHENFKDYEKYFEISPFVEGQFEKHGRTLVYVPTENLNYQTIYNVRVKKELALSGSDMKLDKDYSFAFETVVQKQAQQKKTFRVGDRSFEFSTKHQPVIQVFPEKEIDELHASVFNFDSGEEYQESLKEWNKLPWWSHSKNEFQFNSNALKESGSFDLEIKKNEDKNYIEFPHAFDKGFYLVQISNGDTKTQVWFQVSDLSAYYNITKTDTIVWVNNVKKNKTAEDVKVEIIGSGKSFRTNKEGVATFKTPEEMISNSSDGKNKENFYLKISKKDDTLILPASRIFRNYWWQTPAEANNYWHYFYTDRPLYQSTDTIHYWGLLKQRDNKNIKDKVTVTLYKEGYVDYYYQPINILEQEASFSDLQTFEGEMKIADLRPDSYVLEVRIGKKLIQRKYISIKAYTKPAFDLTMIPDRKVAFAGDDVKIKIKANFFEGTPVPNLQLLFKSPEKEVTVTTDKNGEANVVYNKEYTDCNKKYSCWPAYTYLKVRPKDEELAEIYADANLRFYGPRIKINSKTKYLEEGVAEIKIVAKFIDLEKATENYYWQKDNSGEQSASNMKIEGRVVKITHTKHESGTRYDYINKKTYKTYSYSKKEEEIRKFSVRTDSDGVYLFKQKVEPETSYRIEYKAFDDDSRYNVYRNYLYYYDGKGTRQYSNWNYNYYRLELNKHEFSLGETVDVLFKNNDEPMPEGKRRYLFLQLQNGLQEHSIESRPEYSFDFNFEDIPNVNLSAVYFDGLSYVAVENSYSNQSAKYKHQDRNLDIVVKPDKESYVPGEQVSLSVELKNQKGQPVEAEVNLNLVDEAYYAMVESIANPLETIYSSLDGGIIFSKKTHYNALKEVSGAEEKGGCFAAGTKVIMSNGNEKSIEYIEKGDKILTISDPVSKEIVEGEVSEVWKHTVAEHLFINDELRVTPEHQVFSNGRFIDAGLLAKGDWLLGLNGEKILVSSIVFKHEIITVYNLRIENYHTFFAGGVYVHNEEKGGGPREFFTDAALFKVIRTNSEGKANISFKLPDNITSWRVTSQAISKNLEAGIGITKIPVTLPVFAEVTVGTEYLAEDKPIVRMRAFGTALENEDKTIFSVDASSLGDDELSELKTKAFVPAFYPLPNLSLGKHDIVYNLKTKKGFDSIKLPINVVSSRLQAQVVENQKLATNTEIKIDDNLSAVITLSDRGRNQLYQPLRRLKRSYGDRVDQAFVKSYSEKLLSEYYQESISTGNFQASDYQLANGGISLLPYSKDDLELSARVTALGAEGFDKASLAQYFFKKLENNDSLREELSWSLFGLAELGEPVLLRIHAWLERDDLSPQEKIYLAQALFDLGDKQGSLDVYYEILDGYGQQKEPQVLIKTSANIDETFKATASAAALASSLNSSYADGMFEYLTENQRLYGYYKNSENLFNLEKVNYISHKLPQLSPKSAEISYEFQGKENKVNIVNNVHSFQVPASDVESLKFTSVKGDVDISVNYIASFNPESAQVDRDISIRREYAVNGKISNSFSAGDIIEVRLYPNLSSNALSGEYQVTDFLPSGLSPMVKVYPKNITQDCHYFRPYNVEGQMVKYKIGRYRRNSFCGGYIKYYARVKNRGVYKAEPAVIQSFRNPDFINYSDVQIIRIDE